MHHTTTSYTRPSSTQISSSEYFFSTQKSRERTDEDEEKHINDTSTATILRLVQLILDKQFCVYENHLYRQMLDGSIDSSLMVSLIDIYIFDLLHDLRSVLSEKNKLFARTFNRVIFT